MTMKISMVVDEEHIGDVLKKIIDLAGIKLLWYHVVHQRLMIVLVNHHHIPMIIVAKAQRVKNIFLIILIFFLNIINCFNCIFEKIIN